MIVSERRPTGTACNDWRRERFTCHAERECARGPGVAQLNKREKKRATRGSARASRPRRRWGHKYSQIIATTTILAYRLPIDDQFFVVRSSRLSQVGEHSSGIPLGCGETILYQWDYLSFPQQVSLAPELEFTSDCLTWAVLSFKPLATGLSVLVSCNPILVVLVSPGCEVHSNPVQLETERQSSTPNSSLVSISQLHVPLLLLFFPASASST